LPLQAGFSPVSAAAYEGKSAVLARLLAPDARADLDARRGGQSLMEQARSPAVLRLLRNHPESPVSRMSARVTSAATTGAASAATGVAAALASHAQARLLVRRAVVASVGGRGVDRVVDLGSAAELPHATQRLAPPGDVDAVSPFAPEAPVEGLLAETVAGFEARMAALSLAAAAAAADAAADDGASGGVAPPPALDPTPVTQRVLRELLRTPATAWEPPVNRR
jgi:hypothetical protein